MLYRVKFIETIANEDSVAKSAPKIRTQLVEATSVINALGTVMRHYSDSEREILSITAGRLPYIERQSGDFETQMVRALNY